MNVRGGQLIQSNGNPVFPGTLVTGPLLAGNILRSGGPNQAGLGAQDQNALANVGYVLMTQVGRVTQTASPGQPTGVFASPDLVIPAQSLIWSMNTRGLAAYTGAAATYGVGSPSNPTLFTPAGSATAPAAGAAGVIGPGATTLIPAWTNVGNQDVQLVFTSSNDGTGAMLVIVQYIQGINAAIS